METLDKEFEELIGTNQATESIRALGLTIFKAGFDLGFQIAEDKYKPVPDPEPQPGRVYPAKVKPNDWVGNYADLDEQILFGHLIGGENPTQFPYRVGGKTAGFGLFDDKGQRVYQADLKDEIDRVTEHRLRADMLGAIGIVDHMTHLNNFLNSDLSEKPKGYLVNMMKRIRETGQAHGMWLPIVCDATGSGRLWADSYCVKSTQGKIEGLDQLGGKVAFSAEWLDVEGSQPNKVMEAYLGGNVRFHAQDIADGITIMATIPNRPKTAETGFDLDTANVKKGWRCDTSEAAQIGFTEWFWATFTLNGQLSITEGLKNINDFLGQGGTFKNYTKKVVHGNLTPMSFNSGNYDMTWLDFLTSVYQTLRIEKQQNQLFSILYRAMEKEGIPQDRIDNFISNATFGQPNGPQSVATAAWWHTRISSKRRMIEQNPGPSDEPRANPAFLVPTGKFNREQTDLSFFKQMVTSGKAVDFFVKGYAGGSSSMFVRTITSNPGSELNGRLAEYWLDKCLESIQAKKLVSPMRVKPVWEKEIPYSLLALLKDNDYFSKVLAQWKAAGGHQDKFVGIVPVDDVTPLMGEYGLIEPVFVP
jgi:hypothetical protein